MTLEELEELREGWEFEAKAARTKLPKSIWETYSAMANTTGGRIALGVVEGRDGSLELQGIENVQDVLKDLWSTLENRSAVSVNLLSRSDVQQHTFEGRDYIVIHVPKATREQRPVFIKNNLQNTYLRIHEGDRKATPALVQRMKAEQLNLNDKRVVDDYTLADLHDESVRKYRNILSSQRPTHPYLQLDAEDFLISIGAAQRLRKENQALRPTFGGLWMFGKEVSIREIFPHWHLSYIDKPENDIDSPRWADRVAPDGTWNANIWEFYLRVEPLLMQNLQTPFYLEPGSFARKDNTDIHTAVREAFVNTLVHADYHGLAGVRVIKQRTSFRFVNDGVMLISQDQFWQGGISQTRNPALQGFFTILRLGEREGSGGLTIQSAWTNNHLKPPKLQQDFEHSQTALELSLTALFPKEVLQVLTQRLGETFRQQDELGRTILALAATRNSISHQDIADIHQAHSRDITLKLQELQKKQLLDSIGKGRGTRYKSLLPENPQNELFLSLVDKEQSSAIKPTNSAIKDENSAIKPTNSAIKNERSAIGDIVQQVAASKRSRRSLVREAILALCSNDFLRAEAIATRLNRNAQGLRNDYIIPMLNEGLLVARYPDTPNHPQQAYKRAKEGNS